MTTEPPAHPLAYRNGEWIAAEQLSVPAIDAGFVMGLTVAEQLRTFGGKLFRLEEHLERLQRSLAIVGVTIPQSLTSLRESAHELAAHNHKLLHPGDDLGLCLFVTPGTYATYADAGRAEPLVAMHTYPLPFRFWADKFVRGQDLACTAVEQVPAECWPAELKCRSRMHYYLADREAASRFPGARALMLDREGRVMEATTANVAAWFPEEGLVSPPQARILPGISVAVLKELAASLGMPLSERDILPQELRARAGEVILCSTSVCALPVTKLDGAPIGSGEAGTCYRRLLAAWNELVGLDIAEQARRFSNR